MSVFKVRSCWILIILIAGVIGSQAKSKSKTPPKVELNKTGKAAEAEYTKQLQTLKSEITAALPKIDDSTKTAYMKAIEDEKAAKANPH